MRLKWIYLLIVWGLVGGAAASPMDDLVIREVIREAIIQARLHFGESEFSCDRLMSLSQQLTSSRSCLRWNPWWGVCGGVDHQSCMGYESKGDRSVDLIEYVNEVFAKIDPYSEVLTPRKWQHLVNQSTGDLSGVGLGVQITNGRYVIDKVHMGSPAQKLGLAVGDEIVTINGDQPTREFLSGGIQDQIHRQQSISMTVRHGGGGWRQTYEISPQGFKLAGVDVLRLNDDLAPISMRSDTHHRLVYLWIDISHFSSQSSERLKQQLAALSSYDYHGVIVDLRSNRGGVVSATWEVADQLISGGQIMEIETVSARRTWSYEAHRKVSVSMDVPLVVLMSSSTASSAEWLAQSLRTYRNARLVGEPTSGKNSIQALKSLSHGYGLKVTAGYMKTPTYYPDDPVVRPDVYVNWSQESSSEIPPHRFRCPSVQPLSDPWPLSHSHRRITKPSRIHPMSTEVLKKLLSKSQRSQNHLMTMKYPYHRRGVCWTSLMGEVK